jgi:hypothetical protein
VEKDIIVLKVLKKNLNVLKGPLMMEDLLKTPLIAKIFHPENSAVLLVRQVLSLPLLVLLTMETVKLAIFVSVVHQLKHLMV